ncbi:MAG: thioesterase, partial [bacterium]|nr:thioesterase [bacterium]
MSQNITLFCLPYAGANAYTYRKFQEHHDKCISIRAFDLPGHGKYLKKVPLTSIADMVDYFFKHIQGHLRQPYAIYGHSMGTLIGYALSQKIRQANLPMPAHLFLSGRQGPAVKSRQKDWHLLPQEQFIEKVKSYGGLPAPIAQEKELMELFTPILKADFQAVSGYSYTRAEPLDVPVTVLMGLEEDYTFEEALDWQRITSRKLVVKQFPGNHFFIFEHLAEIGSAISRT